MFVSFIVASSLSAQAEGGRVLNDVSPHLGRGEQERSRLEQCTLKEQALHWGLVATRHHFTIVFRVCQSSHPRGDIFRDTNHSGTVLHFDLWFARAVVRVAGTNASVIVRVGCARCSKRM